MIKLIKYFFECCFIYLFFLIAKIIGINFSRKLFSQIFIYVGPLIKSKKIIDKNLKIFSKNITDKHKAKIITSMWSNYGMTFIEYIFLKKFRNSSSHIRIEGEEVLNDILNKNKQVIFISGHFANFELMSMELTKRKINLATIYRPLNNIFINPLMEYLRKKYVCGFQIKKGRSGVREAMNYIQKKFSIALMVDQRVSEGEKVKFFNVDSFTSTLPAQLALKYNLDIVPIFLERKNDKFFFMKVLKPINPEKIGNKIEVTKKINKIIEDMITKNPYQWIWTHDRWK